jgi:hypothetical protein
VEGGDRDGDRYPVELTRKEWRVGRGRWHQEDGPGRRVANDVVLTDTLPWVSRAAAVLRRTGAHLDVEAREQGEFLIVVRQDGSQVRPAVTASGKAPLRVGERIELHDGRDARLCLRLDPAEEGC